MKLTSDEKLRLGQLEISIRDREKARYRNFRSFLKESNYNSFTDSQNRLLWSTFIEYIYNNFFDYGEEALKRLHPHIQHHEKFENEEDYFQIAFTKLKNQQLCQVFRFVVDKFPDYASQDDIDFLNDLAQKTLSFASLGIDPKLASTAVDVALVDWVLYLDTNVLYSILSLHSHPENEATKALISLINENREYLKVVFRYSELTKKELNAKRGDFELLDNKLSDSGIKALIKSDDLDDFSRQYYTRLLEDRDSSLHPSEIIELSNQLLKKDQIDVSRNAKRVDQLGEVYLNNKVQDYRNYIDWKNQIKENFCRNKNIAFYPISKSDKQITHDITLREVILDMRRKAGEKSGSVDFNSIKYFGLTLDELLAEFDVKQIKDYGDERSFPVFFRPSFLLNKLVRVLPLKTADYKKAFLKAVTSKGFNRDIKRSRDILKVVNYLKSRGIDDEKVIASMISEDIFLEKFQKNREKQEFNQEDFFESELNRQLSTREKELEETKQELQRKKTETNFSREQNLKLKNREEDLESDLHTYKKAVRKLKGNISKVTRNAERNARSQTAIDFERENIRKENERIKRQLSEQIHLEIENYKKIKLKYWQRSTWWNLFWLIPITLTALTLILFPNLIPDAKVDKTSIRVILGVLILLVDGIFIYLIKSRYWDEGNKQKRIENTAVPQNLSEKLKMLDTGEN